MSETKKFKAQIAKSNVKATKITVIGSVLVALIGFLGMIYVNSKTDDNKESHQKLVQALMNQLNTLVIPQIQKELQEINITLKELSQDESAARERIARLEGLIEALSKFHSHRIKETPKRVDMIPKLVKVKKPIKLLKIDTSKVIQQTLNK